MGQAQPPRRGTSAKAGRRTAWVLVALALVSINLRPAITTIAGTMGQLQAGFGLDAHLLPLLGALPVLAFGVSAPCGPWLARRLGTGRAVAAALLTLAAALLVRVLVPGLLLPGTFLAGASIMTASVLAPQIVKANRGTGWWTGLCTMGFGLGAALGAGLVQPLQQTLGGSLAGALAVWAVPALLGAALIHRAGQTARRPDGTGETGETGGAASGAGLQETTTADVATREAGTIPLRKQRTAWTVTAFFGLQAMLYFAVTSWLAVFLVSKGQTAADAAGLLAWFSVAGLPASLLAPVLAGRRAVLKVMAPGLGLLVAAALIGVLTAPVALQFLMVGLLGIAQSAGFGLGMALVVIRSAGAESAGSLSAMSQGWGFALASLGPLGAGFLHEWSGGWDVPFWVLAAEAVLLAVAGFLAVRGPAVSVAAAEMEHLGEPAAVGR
ncbi:MFS transporter [Arthrobacter sp. KNU-44]|uniref:MFS transporter n=1 Tax=unclassified Arthrobacter TaxID=235627 RepID=UPI003F42B65B